MSDIYVHGIRIIVEDLIAPRLSQVSSRQKTYKMLPEMTRPEDHRDRYFVLGSVIVGLLVFSLYYPFFILNPYNVDWIFNHGDISTHHLGLLYFLKDSWRFPLGINPSYGMENGSSIVYTDSIPILGLALKLFFGTNSKGEIQMMGFFLLISSWANVFITYLITRRYSSQRVLCLLAAWIIALIPIGAWRMMPALGHTSLTAQFVVIGAVGIYFFRTHCSILLRVFWLLLSFGIHPYFGFMASFLWGGAAVDRILNGKFRFKFLLISSVELLCLIVGVYIFGYLGFSFDRSSWGYGFFGYNLLDFIDPTGYDEGPIDSLKVSFSSIGLWASTDRDTSWEGFNYLGFGIFLMLVVNIIVGVGSLVGNSQKVWRLKKFTTTRLFTIASILALFLISVTHEINIGDSRYLVADKFYVDKGLIESLSVVRSSARLAWPLIYAVVIGSTCFALSCIDNMPSKANLFGGFLVFCVALQYLDLGGAASILRSSYGPHPLTEFERMLSTYVEQRKPKSLRLIHPESSSHKFLGIARIGSIHGVPTNVIYSARSINTERESYRQCPADSIVIIPKGGEWMPDPSCSLKSLGSSEGFTIYAVQK